MSHESGCKLTNIAASRKFSVVSPDICNRYLPLDVCEEASRTLLHHVLHPHPHLDVLHKPAQERHEVLAFPDGARHRLVKNVVRQDGVGEDLLCLPAR